VGGSQVYLARALAILGPCRARRRLVVAQALGNFRNFVAAHHGEREQGEPREHHFADQCSVLCNLGNNVIYLNVVLYIYSRVLASLPLSSA
jgi:hypothetical protein